MISTSTSSSQATFWGRLAGRLLSGGSLYRLTIRAYLAILLKKIDLDDFIQKAPEVSIISVLMALTSSFVK